MDHSAGLFQQVRLGIVADAMIAPWCSACDGAEPW
jgi:hypothetical protein